MRVFLRSQMRERLLARMKNKGNTVHILVVDDDQSILEVVETFIRFSTDHTAETASCAADAIDLLARPGMKGFDCFLIDIQMPRIDGIELCNILRNRPDSKRSLIMMLTAMTEKSYLDRAFAAGADDYITKPFDIRDLGERLGTTERINRRPLRATLIPQKASLA